MWHIRRHLFGLHYSSLVIPFPNSDAADSRRKGSKYDHNKRRKQNSRKPAPTLLPQVQRIPVTIIHDREATSQRLATVGIWRTCDHPLLSAIHHPPSTTFFTLGNASPPN
ncbi:hypothetical protein HZ326_4659 [Fusarium oxysporum f. sp. albedinis]|nr:hypothetical protein HZ326_4659 [Fusarium oxysporum f. sp. albedinis]